MRLFAARWSLVILLLLAVAPQVAAITLSEYRKHLQVAITDLDSLSEIKDESQENFERRLEITAAIRKALPRKQTIEVGTLVTNVDNDWLHEKLGEFDVASYSQRTIVRHQIVETLKAIETRVGELENASAAHALSKSEANKKIEEILARSEYGSQSRAESALMRLLRRFIRWIAQFLPEQSPLSSSHGSSLTVVAQVAVVGFAVAVIVFALIKLLGYLRRRPRKEKAKKKNEPRIILGERLEPEASARDLLAEAETLARSGEIRAAIRKAYIALLVELGERKVLSLEQHKTNRDYLRSVRSFPSLHTNMSSLTDTFERHWYGFAQSSLADWENFRAGYLSALSVSE